MNAADPCLVHVIEEATTDIPPKEAVLHVRLLADRFFSGRAALEKAEELCRLAESLKQRGFADDAVSLAGASLDVSSGVFSKSSSVTYDVRIRVRDVERLGEALDAVAASKRATLSEMTWDYDAAATRAELVADCGARALTKAKRLAAAVGASIERVHSAKEEEPFDGGIPAVPLAGYGAPTGPMKMRASIATEMMGLDLAPKKSITVRVRLECRIAQL